MYYVQTCDKLGKALQTKFLQNRATAVNRSKVLSWLYALPVSPLTVSNYTVTTFQTTANSMTFQVGIATLTRYWSNGSEPGYSHTHSGD